MNSHTDSHHPQRMNPASYVDPFTFSLAPPWGILFWNKIPWQSLGWLGSFHFFCMYEESFSTQYVCYINIISSYYFYFFLFQLLKYKDLLLFSDLYHNKLKFGGFILLNIVLSVLVVLSTSLLKLKKCRWIEIGADVHYSQLMDP